MPAHPKPIPRYRVYGFSGCSYCRKTTSLLEEMSIPYEYIALESPQQRVEFLNARGFREGERTYPRIWRLSPTGEEQEFVGGFSELEMEVLLAAADHSQRKH